MHSARTHARAHAPAAAVTDLFIYPVKGCAPLRVARAEVTPRGLAGDRLFLLVDFVGRMQTQRQLPAMATVRAQFDERGDLVLSAPGMADFVLARKRFADGERKSVTVWGYECADAVDQGDDAASWFSKALDASGLRLVRMPDDHVRPVRSKGGDGEQGASRLSDPAAHQTSFSDKYPFLLTSESSLQRVRDESAVAELSMQRFRPNIVVGAASGLGPFDEHAWVRLKVGDTRFEVAEQCTRCQVPRIDPSSGVTRTDNEPTATLKRLANNCFGQNVCALDFGGTLAVGDPLVVEVRDDSAPLK